MDIKYVHEQILARGIPYEYKSLTESGKFKTRYRYGKDYVLLQYGYPHEYNDWYHHIDARIVNSHGSWLGPIVEGDFRTENELEELLLEIDELLKIPRFQ